IVVNLAKDLGRRRIIQTIPFSCTICGMAVLGRKLFVLAEAPEQQILVYMSDASGYTLERHIVVTTKMETPNDLVACAKHKCIYISDMVPLYVVHRVGVQTGTCTSWSVSDSPRGLSLTKDNHLLVTLRFELRLEMYSTDGQLTRRINLDSRIQG